MFQGIMEFVKDAIFDTLFVPENLHEGKGSMFCIPLGQYAGRNIKEFAHTNMYCAGQLDAPKKFLIKSFHCGIFEGSLPVPTSHRVWDGRFTFESMAETIFDCPLREIADENVKALIRTAKRDDKRTNLQEIENPLEDFSEFEEQLEISHQYYSRKWGKNPGGQIFPPVPDPGAPKPSGLLLDQCQPFMAWITFDHPINVPMDVIVAMNGILARAVV